MDQTFKLHSRPNAPRKIYLDFDGHVTEGMPWNNQNRPRIESAPVDKDGNPGTFNDAERIYIQEVWQRVAEDFAPFEVDVTTEEPGAAALTRSNTGDQTYGIRVVISPTSDWYPGAGGVAYLRSFDDNRDNPCFVFYGPGGTNSKSSAEVSSHEIGHTLGLYHDGVTNGPAYYGGHGAWGPIMGVSYRPRVTQWCKGEYADANQLQDDLQVMQQVGSFGLRPDDHGDTISNATEISHLNFNAGGLIRRDDDTDWFTFRCGEGEAVIQVDGALGTNLNLSMRLLDASGTVLTEQNPTGSEAAAFRQSLAAGRYFLEITGAGELNPLDTGYSAYGSLGQYTLSGTIPEPDVGTQVIAQSGRLTAAQSNRTSWTRVALDHTFTQPIVVMGGLTRNGSHPSTLRVSQVTGNRFDFQIDEWDYLDGGHTTEQMSYMVAERGAFRLPDGRLLIADRANLDHQTLYVPFAQAFDETPVVIAQVATFNGGSAVTVRVRNVTREGFEMKLSEEEGNDGTHAVESVHFIALGQGAGRAGGLNYAGVRTTNSYTHTWKAIDLAQSVADNAAFLTQMQTTDGGDCSDIRVRSLGADGLDVMIEEESSRDSEVAHTTEVMGVIAMDPGLLEIEAGAPVEKRERLTLVSTLGEEQDPAWFNSEWVSLQSQKSGRPGLVHFEEQYREPIIALIDGDLSITEVTPTQMTYVSDNNATGTLLIQERGLVETKTGQRVFAASITLDDETVRLMVPAELGELDAFYATVVSKENLVAQTIAVETAADGSLLLRLEQQPHQPKPKKEQVHIIAFGE